MCCKSNSYSKFKWQDTTFSDLLYCKTETCLPENATVKEHFLFSYNEKHWSNEVETLSLIDMIIVPYIENLKKKLQVPNN